MHRFSIALLLSLLCACSEQASENATSTSNETIVGIAAKQERLVVHKSPTCGCCGAWVDHVNRAGLLTTVVEDSDLSALKERFGILPQARSCHTAIYDNTFVFEGHVPPSVMQRFLDAPPSGAKGLVVPGMPVGSPGMEDGERFQPYKVWLLSDTGEFTEYATIENYDQQF